MWILFFTPLFIVFKFCHDSHGIAVLCAHPYPVMTNCTLTYCDKVAWGIGQCHILPPALCPAEGFRLA